MSHFKPREDAEWVSGGRRFVRSNNETKWAVTWAEFRKAGGITHFCEDQTEIYLTLPVGWKFSIRFMDDAVVAQQKKPVEDLPTPHLGKLAKLFDRVQGDAGVESLFRSLARSLLVRVAEIDSQITKSAYYTGDDSAIKRGDFDTPPTGDDYNLLFDAIMDEIIALLPPES